MEELQPILDAVLDYMGLTGEQPPHPFVNNATATWRLGLAVLCGATVGWERARWHKHAGLRTHILICLGACLFALIGLQVSRDFPHSDPLRLVQGVLLGIGFISGGVIVIDGSSVRGLTTAAGLWLLTAIGLAIGLGQYYYAIVGTLISFSIMMWLRPLKGAFRRTPDDET